MSETPCRPAINDDAKWDESARRLLALAREESFAIGDQYIGVQHLLLAAVSLTPFEQHGLTALNREAVLAAIVECIGVLPRDQCLFSPGGQTPRAKQVIRHAWERAESQSRPVSRRDIWSGLLSDETSHIPNVLSHLGLTLKAVRDKLV
jgi:ATP-dependent Clp protease ATP-binding subunit ClpA